jgi:hypothetical protein
LANLLFTTELSRRLVASGVRTMAVSAHPGWTRSNLAAGGSALDPNRVRRRMGRLTSALGQSTVTGALPTLCAATSSHIVPGDYIGPSRWFQMAGPPRHTRPRRKGTNPAASAALWAESERLTGVTYSVGALV